MNEKLEITLPMAELLIIKRDFELLKKIATQMKPELQMQLIPYLALFCYEASDYFINKGYPIVIDKTSRYSIKDIRQKAKFFDLSINKLFQSVRNVDDLQNDYFIQSMKYPEIGKWNVHDNIGIWFDECDNIVGNSQYAYYVFQDEKMISKPKNEMNGHVLQGKEIYNFSSDMGRIIGSISTGLSSVSDFVTADFTTETLIIHSKDFNTNRCRAAGNEVYKIIKIFLLHVLSSIGFIIYALKKCIIRDTGLLLRLEYITYHYTIRRLEGIKNYVNTKQEEINDIKLREVLNSIDYSNERGLFNSEFRNCMMHFGLKTKQDSSLIEESKVDFSVPFCGLIESQFCDVNYKSYQNNIETELSFIHDILQRYLCF